MSGILFRCSAANTPRGIDTRTDQTQATRANLMVFGKKSLTVSMVDRPVTREVPRSNLAARTMKM